MQNDIVQEKVETHTETADNLRRRPAETSDYRRELSLGASMDVVPLIGYGLFGFTLFFWILFICFRILFNLHCCRKYQGSNTTDRSNQDSGNSPSGGHVHGRTYTDLEMSMRSTGSRQYDSIQDNAGFEDVDKDVMHETFDGSRMPPYPAPSPPSDTSYLKPSALPSLPKAPPRKTRSPQNHAQLPTPKSALNIIAFAKSKLFGQRNDVQETTESHKEATDGDKHVYVEIVESVTDSLEDTSKESSTDEISKKQEDAKKSPSAEPSAQLSMKEVTASHKRCHGGGALNSQATERDSNRITVYQKQREDDYEVYDMPEKNTK